MTLHLKDMTLLKNKGLIGGQWVDAESGKRFAVTDPASGATVVIARSRGGGPPPECAGPACR